MRGQSWDVKRQTSERQNVRTSERQNVRTSERQNVRTSERQNVRTSERQNVRTSERQNVRTSERQNVRTSERQNVRTSERQNVRTSERQNVRTSERQNVRTSERQNVRTSERQNVKTSKPQNVRRRNVLFAGFWKKLKQFVLFLRWGEIRLLSPETTKNLLPTVKRSVTNDNCPTSAVSVFRGERTSKEQNMATCRNVRLPIIDALQKGNQWLSLYPGATDSSALINLVYRWGVVAEVWLSLAQCF